MALSSALNHIEKRYAWSLLGFVLATVFGLFSLYTEFWRDRRPQLRFEIVSDASVLDVREQLGNLEVIYDGVDIQKAKTSLRVIIVRITNEGPDDILKTHYDEEAPLGFRVASGTLIRAEVFASSSPYLRDSLARVHQATDRVVFPPVILEAGEWFTVKSLILHSDGTRPMLAPVGKVAGVREIRLIDSTESAVEPGFWREAFAGGPWIQAARLPAYFFGLILVFAGIGIPIGIAGAALSKRRRRQYVSQFKSVTKIQLLDTDEFIFEGYVEHGLDYLQSLRRVSTNEGRLNYEVRRYERRKEQRPELREGEGILFGPDGRPIQGWRPPIAAMQNAGFITKGEKHWQIDPHLRQTLDEFVRFVEIKRAA